MGRKLRRVVIGLSLFLLLLPLALLGLMAGWGRMRMGAMLGAPRFVAGAEAYQGAAFCGGCHQAEYDQWRTSLMANATTEAMFAHRSRQLAWMMPPEQCLGCHAPLARTGTGPREEGVSCEVCHGPGRTEVTVRNLCVACHQDRMDFVLTTASEYAASPAAADGRTCESCHMPRVDGVASHHFAGSRAAPDSYAGVVAIEDIALDGESVVVTVRNTVEGHFLPTAAEVNALYLDVVGYDAAGRTVLRQTYPFQKAVFSIGTMPMQVLSDNRLRPGERRQVVFAGAEHPVRLHASVVMRPVGVDGKRREFTVSEKEVVEPGNDGGR